MTIHKIGAVILRHKQLLVVRKKAKANGEFIIPGGRPEQGETHLETLARELQEELSVCFTNPEHFGTFEDTAIFEQVPLVMDVYMVTLTGNPKPASEIKECLWIGRDYAQPGMPLGSVLEKHIIPKLVARGEM